MVSAVAERVYSGFQCPMVMDADREKSSQMDHAKMEAFLEKNLTGDLAEDFTGIGPESAKKLKRAGVRTSWLGTTHTFVLSDAHALAGSCLARLLSLMAMQMSSRTSSLQTVPRRPTRPP